MEHGNIFYILKRDKNADQDQRTCITKRCER